MQTWHKSQKSVKVWHLGITKQRVLKVFLLLVFFSKNPSVYPWSTILTPCPPKYIYWLLLIRMLTLEHSVGEPQGKWEWEYKESFWWEHVAWLVASPVCRLEQVRLSSQVVISATSLGAFKFIRARELDKQIANALTVVLNMLPRMNLNAMGRFSVGSLNTSRNYNDPISTHQGKVWAVCAVQERFYKPCHATFFQCQAAIPPRSSFLSSSLPASAPSTASRYSQFCSFRIVLLLLVLLTDWSK